MTAVGRIYIWSDAFLLRVPGGVRFSVGLLAKLRGLFEAKFARAAWFQRWFAAWSTALLNA